MWGPPPNYTIATAKPASATARNRQPFAPPVDRCATGVQPVCKALKTALINMVGFAVMLITYFDVNDLATIGGGMHSYTEPIAR